MRRLAIIGGLSLMTTGAASAIASGGFFVAFGITYRL